MMKNRSYPRSELRAESKRCLILRVLKRNLEGYMEENTQKVISQRYGGIAQLGEHLLCKQGVNGSIPFISTKQRKLQKKAKS